MCKDNDVPIYVLLFCCFQATRVVHTQTMVTWSIWYIYEGFLVWIIFSTYQSHESTIWAYTTSFVHTYIWRILDVSSHVYVCLCSRHSFNICFDSDLLMHVYLLDFAFNIDSLVTIYVTDHCLYLHAWTTSLWLCTRVFACARHLASFYVLVGLFSDNPGPACPDPEAHGSMMETLDLW